MAIVTAEIRFAPQLAAWFTANPTLVLADGELAYCSDGANAGKYKLGDGTTQLSALTFYGGVSSSGLTVGTTTITSGTNTRILYNNSGVVGEYLVTGTGTTAVLSTSPTFTTDITTPLIIGGSAVGSVIQYKGTSGNGTSTVAAHQFLVGNNGATTAASIYNDGQYIVGTNTRIGGALGIFQTNINSATVTLGAWGASQAAIWMQQATPTTVNYILRSSGSEVILNAPSSSIQFNYAGTNRHNFYGIGVSFAPTNTTGTAFTTYTFGVPAHTGQTASTNIPVFKVTGNTLQWATGPLSAQYFNYFSANTISFVGPSTATLAANLSVSYLQGGTNATIATSAAIYVPTLALTNTTTGIGLLIEGPTGATNKYAAKFIQGTGTTYIGEWASGRGGIWFNNTPSASNFHVGANATGTDGYLNGSTASRLLANGNIIVSAFPTQVTFLPAAATGSTVNFDFTSPNNTSRTALTNVPNLIVRGSTTVWNPGTVPLQYFNWLTANTVSTASASTFTLVCNAYVDAPLSAGSATATNLAALGIGGHCFIANSVGVPSNNPTGGGLLYVESGALKYRGSSGTVTTLGAA